MSARLPVVARLQLVGGDSGPRALDQLPELSDDELDAVIPESLAAQLAVGVTAGRDPGDARWAVTDRHRAHFADSRAFADDSGFGPCVRGAPVPVANRGATSR